MAEIQKQTSFLKKIHKNKIFIETFVIFDSELFFEILT